MKTQKISNKWLLEEFERLNERFFDCKIHHIRLAFRPLKGKQGVWNPQERLILINSNLIPTGVDFITITLLHEMCHAALECNREYVGYPSDDGHGTLFQGEICRLIKAGAYDGLL